MFAITYHMKFIIGVITGILLSVAIFVFYLYPSTKESWHKQGMNDGTLKAQQEIMKSVSGEFDNVEFKEGNKLLFRFKDSAVYIIEKDGKKTLGITQ